MSAQYEFNEFVAHFIEGALEAQVENSIGSGLYRRGSQEHDLVSNTLDSFVSELDHLLEATKDA